MKTHITNIKKTPESRQTINKEARYSSGLSLLGDSQPPYQRTKVPKWKKVIQAMNYKSSKWGHQTVEGASNRRSVNKQRGQGLIEYLILVALMGVATIGIIRVLNQTIKARFASAVYALQGKPKKVKTESVKEQDYKKSDLSNFMNGAASKKK